MLSLERSTDEVLGLEFLPVGIEGAHDIVQHQRYYRARVADAAVTFANLEAVEIATTLGYRWWSLEALRATSEQVIDDQLAAITATLGDTD